MSKLLLYYILTCKTLKQPLFSSENVFDILPVLLSDLVVTEFKPQRRRQESLLFTILKVCYCVCLRECRCVCICVCVRGKKCQGIHCLFSTCYYSGPNQPASQSGASGHLETLLCL